MRIRKSVAALVVAAGMLAGLAAVAPAVAGAAPLPVVAVAPASAVVSAAATPAFGVGVVHPDTSGWQCVTHMCGQVVGTGLNISYLHYGMYSGLSHWCGFIETIEETQNRAWSAVQTSGTVCSSYAGVIGNFGIYRTMPAAGELYEYGIPLAGFPSLGVNVFYIN